MGGNFAAAGLTFYCANGGIDSWAAAWPNENGFLYWRSKTSIQSIADGTSNTLAVGDRPPSPDLGFGWWQSLDTFGSGGSWAYGNYVWEYDTVQYVRNTNGSPYSTNYTTNQACPFPSIFQPGQIDNYCSFNNFWSFHPGGVNFAYVDGSVHFIPYTAQAVMPALASRAGGEAQTNF